MTTYVFTSALASRFAELALHCIGREYPYNPAHVITGPDDIATPRVLHPAFYGCFDWHSAVHGHWLLARVLHRFPDLPQAAEIRAGLAANLTEANLAAEAAYFRATGRSGFERTYGWAWLLKLAEELGDWDDPDGRRWSRDLAPLADVVVARYLDFLPRQTYPIRAGTHPNTAFGLAYALDYAAATGQGTLYSLVRQRSLDYYATDRAYPAGWEPGGNDFFSPCLMEADLMRRVLPAAEFTAWLDRFLPGLVAGEPASLLTPATVTDRADGQLVHLDGLNLSRAWCMWSIAAALPANDVRCQALIASAAQHASAGLAGVASGDYMGDHWLATFAAAVLEAAEAYDHSLNISTDSALVWRALDANDLPALVSLSAACLTADGGLPFAADPSFFRSRYLPEAPGKTLGALSPTAGLVAAAAVRLEARATIVGQVHPDWRGRGIGATLIRWGTTQADALLEACPDAERTVEIATESLTAAADRLYRRHGFAQTFAEDVMRRDLGEPLPETPLPQGITLASWQPTLAGAFYEAYWASFRDRPGFQGMSQTDWIDWATEDEDFVPEMSLLASAGDLPAGFTICDHSWVAQIGVRPEWRGRGLGAALLGEVLRRFQGTGSAAVSLDVNVNNPTARRLYDRLHFVQIGRRARYTRQDHT